MQIKKTEYIYCKFCSYKYFCAV